MITDQRTGATRLAEGLRAKGVTTIFSVSGNQINSVYEAVASAGLRIIHMRHESATAYAAAGWADVTGEVGVALVCGGPGFLAALTGTSIATSMEASILLISGGPPTDGDAAGAFQYIDQDGIARAICKTSFHARSGPHVDAVVDAAWDAALAPIPGPVHINLPMDVAKSSVEESGSYDSQLSAMQFASHVSDSDRQTIQGIAAALKVSKRPIVIARPSAARGTAGDALRAIGKRLGVRPSSSSARVVPKT